MGKTIRFNENGLIAIKKKLNEIMVGTESVSHNDVLGNVKLYHGTDILALVNILKTNRICASEGVQHGETHGLNWFSLVNDGSFNRGACFSLDVPADEIGTTFKKMNNVHLITRDSYLDISNYNIQIEYFCGFSREGIINLYNNLVKKGEKYPIEWIRDDLFYKWCEKSGNEDVYMSVSDYDFGVIMVNILGEDKVRKEGFIKENMINEVAPEVDEFTIGGEEKDGDVVAGGNYFHVKQSTVSENVEGEVESSEVDLSSFKKRDTLPPGIWKDEETLNSKVRLKLLDIADDFWEFVNLTWVEPKGIILTGSICNFNWSKFSDIDLHLIVDFSEVDSKTEFVRQYLDSKKNEWNNEHETLKIMGFPVELYVQNIDENPEAGGIYDLEENAWVRKPNPHTIKSIGLNKFNIKDKAAEIMTIIDDMYQALDVTDDSYKVEQIGNDASYLWKKVKNLRKKSLDKNGESGAGNIVYKVLRRTGYLDKLWKLSTRVYDRSNSINEGANYDAFCTNQALRYKVIYKMAEDGYIFHGADNEWDEFDSNKVKGGSRGIYGYGAYFTNAAYKCEEYGNKFMILDSHDFNFLNINEKVHKSNNIFYEKFREFSILQDELDNCRNVREYDYYSELLEKYKSTINRRLLEQFVNLIDSSASDMTYRILNANVGGYEDIKKEISELYLALGYDGFICDNQFVVFNFEKLNQNIVKNKEELISKYIVTESVKKYLTVLKEEVAVDGSTEHNPYEKRWKAERDALKNFIANYGKLMQSKEDNKGGKLYKVYFDETMSSLIGYNYCICVQWNEQEMKPGSTVYIRALDKFTPFIRRNLQFDNRGRDNMRGTYDDTQTY